MEALGIHFFTNVKPGGSKYVKITKNLFLGNIIALCCPLPQLCFVKKWWR